MLNNLCTDRPFNSNYYFNSKHAASLLLLCAFSVSAVSTVNRAILYTVYWPKYSLYVWHDIVKVRTVFCTHFVYLTFLLHVHACTRIFTNRPVHEMIAWIYFETRVFHWEYYLARSECYLYNYIALACILRFIVMVRQRTVSWRFNKVTSKPAINVHH